MQINIIYYKKFKVNFASSIMNNYSVHDRFRLNAIIR